jgi:hypothetical protein
MMCLVVSAKSRKAKMLGTRNSKKLNGKKNTRKIALPSFLATRVEEK